MNLACYRAGTGQVLHLEPEKWIELAATTGEPLTLQGEAARYIHVRLCRLNTLEKFIRQGDIRSAQALVAQEP